MKIFLIEDDKVISSRIKEDFENWGYQLDICQNLKNPLEEFLADSYRLVIMDLGLPFYNGYHWTREIRKFSNIPIIFLSSASDKLNIIMAMDLGADDYISKPFDMEVLLAKVRALLRRTFDQAAQMDILAYRDLYLDLAQMTISSPDKTLGLTKNEFKILDILIRNKGRVLSREEIMERLWESSHFIDDNTLSVNVARLRRKLAQLSGEKIIYTKVGVGYYVKKD